MKRIEVRIFSDESGRFRAKTRDGSEAFGGEPFLLAALVGWGEGLPPRAVSELWSSLELGHYAEFHATELRGDRRARLDQAMGVVLEGVGAMHQSQVRVVAHRFNGSAGLPREDVYLDLVFHLVLRAVRGAVQAEVEDAGRTAAWSGLVPLKVELNLARRSGLNLRPMQAALERAIRSDLRTSNLGRDPDKRQGFLLRGVNLTRVRVHCSVAPASMSEHLALSDLLCNGYFRALTGGGSAETESVELIGAQNLELVPELEWASILADAPQQALAPVASAAPPPRGELRATLQAAAFGPPSSDPLARLKGRGVWPQEWSAEERHRAIAALLEASEHACEVERDLARAEALAGLACALLSDKDWRRGLGEEVRLRLGLDADSVRLAISNHQGRPLPAWMDVAAANARSGRLWGEAGHRDPIALLHNRLAVNALNRFAFREALQRTEPLVRLLAQSAALGNEVFGRPAASWQLGALHGTRGQAMVMQGYVERNAALIEQGIEQFFAASEHFTAPGDKLRQCSYIAHAYIDRVRLEEGRAFPETWANLIGMMGEELDADVQSFCADPFGADAGRQAFGVHVRLKEAWVMGETPRWAAALVDALSRGVTETPLRHPMQQIAGLLSLLLELPATHPLVAAVARTANSGKGLVELIARVYALDIAAAGGAPSESALAGLDASVPDWLRPGWDAAGMPAAVRRAAEIGAVVEVLPFNYF